MLCMINIKTSTDDTAIATNAGEHVVRFVNNEVMEEEEEEEFVNDVGDDDNDDDAEAAVVRGDKVLPTGTGTRRCFNNDGVLL
jgi:hypothetical protein